jgi:spermidine/putrescine transport system ATP-binding protein
MIAEHTLNKLESGIVHDRDYHLELFDGKIACNLTGVIPGARYDENGVLTDVHGDEIDTDKLKVIVAIKPADITMSDDEDAGVINGNIINLIYKGDHYSYVVRTDIDEDFIVSDEYLWNMDDRVSLIIPEDKVTFTLKK